MNAKPETTDRKKQVAAALALLLAVSECIRDLKAVPSGHLYAQLSDKLSYNEYIKIIDILKNAGMIRESNHLLTWVGGK